MPSWRNARRGDPCAVCGKPSWCSRSDDGAWALCRRIDTDGIHRVDSAGVDYWLHRLADSPAAPPVVHDEPRAERAGAEDLDRVYRVVLANLSLSSAHRAALTGRGLDADAITTGMYRTLPPRGRAELARAVLERFPERLVLSVPGFHRQENGRGGYVTFGGAQGLLVPVLDVEGRVVALKVRVDKADEEGPRYLYVSSTGHGGPGPGAPVHVPARAAADGTVGDDGSVDVVRVTEGELKANVATALSGILTVSVPGVSAWRGVLAVLRALRPDRVLLAFDADAATNAHVARATEATAEALSREGWDVAIEVWDGQRAKGIDDALAAGVDIEGRTWIVPTTPEPKVEEPPQEANCYRATKCGLVWIRPTKDGPVEQHLTNFTARIINDVMEDDGAEVRRRFEIEAGLLGCRRTFTVAAESFAGMGWATEHLGARAIVFPGFGVKDHGRAAVQLLSGDIPERHVFSHTGWRELGHLGWVYLHAGGAVGSRGMIPGIEVSLPDSLTRLELPPPPEADYLQDAIRASLGVIDAAPDRVILPLLAAVYRAVLGETDFSVHLAGSSGAGKSELAALAQGHFGAGMDARNLPGSWSSTANALEGLAFAAKDALLVVDDFAPSGSVTDTERAHREADRILRAQGNRSGRLRMRADGSLRTARPPRGLILSTGEDVPRGQSLRARMLVLELERGDVDWDALTRCQRAAADGDLARSMSGFLRWMAPHYDEIRTGLVAQLPALREAASSGSHRRTPELVANLATGFGLFLAFGRSVGALVEDECVHLWGRAWDSLGEAAASQAHHQAGAEPAQRFVELLRSALASGRAHLAGPKGGKPEEDEGAWGWRRNDYGHDEPHGARIGWLDGDGVWLDPDASYAAAQRLGQEVGDRLAVQPQTLRKRLNERGVLASTDGRRKTLTLRKSFEGQRREVLHLDRQTLSPPVAEPAQADQIDVDAPADGVSWEGFSAGWEGVVNFRKRPPSQEKRPSACGFVPSGQVGQLLRR